MTWKEILFSFQGRIPRQTFWIWAIGTSLLMFIVAFIIGLIFGSAAHYDPSTGRVTGGGLNPIGILLILPFYVFAVWSGLALQIKRWHDRGKQGWWVLIALIPVVGAIWSFVECGCLRGTVGPNQFGEDPTT